MLYFGVLAVRYFRKENSVLSLGVEVLLISGVLKIILPWAWVLLAREIVIACPIRLKDLPLYLA